MITTGIPEGSLASRYDALLCDLDGVVYAGPDAVPGAVEALSTAIAAGMPVGFVTNNASRPAQAVAEHLRGLDIDTDAAHVFGSARAGAQLAALDAARRGVEHPTALVVGAQILREEAEAAGFVLVESTDEAVADYVLQGFDPGLGWVDLARAAYTIQRGAVWVATNTDSTIPRAPGLAPGNGSLVAAVRAAVDVEPLVAGKPAPALMELAARELGATNPLMIGDRLDTDIAGGVAAGFDTALVLTGVNTREDAARADASERPTHILESLTALLEQAASA